MDKIKKIIQSHDADTSNSAVYWTGIYLDHAFTPQEVQIEIPISGNYTPPSQEENKIAVEILEAIEGKERKSISKLTPKVREKYINKIVVLADERFTMEQGTGDLKHKR